MLPAPPRTSVRPKLKKQKTPRTKPCAQGNASKTMIFSDAALQVIHCPKFPKVLAWLECLGQKLRKTEK
jgi:hypothetical protein